MPTYRSFTEQGGIQIQVEGDATSGRTYAVELGSALHGVAHAIALQVARLPKEQRPCEFSVSFGLKALATGGFAVSLGDADPSFRVTMKWTEAGDGGTVAAQGLFPELP